MCEKKLWGEGVLERGAEARPHLRCRPNSLSLHWTLYTCGSASSHAVSRPLKVIVLTKSVILDQMSQCVLRVMILTKNHNFAQNSQC